MRLAGLDLNLLVVLDALLTESSVTKAAKRLGLSQSAASHALGRLRTLLDDPILVRTASGMVVTPRAADLVEPVRRTLQAAERALGGGPEFDPATSHATFRLGLESAAQLTLLPALVERLQEVAPNIALKVIPMQPDRLRENFETASIDLAITPLVPPTRKGLLAEEVVSSDYVCITRTGHPTIRQKLTLKSYLESDHVTVDHPNQVDREIEQFLTERGDRRRIQLTVSTPATIPTLVARTDLVATVPRALLDLGDEPAGLRRHLLPFDIEPVSVYLVHHERTRGSTGHEWLLDEIRMLLRNLVGE